MKTRLTVLILSFLAVLLWTYPAASAQSIAPRQLPFPSNAGNVGATGVNACGDIVGGTSSPDVLPSRAVWWDDRTFAYLPGDGARAAAINNRGQIVGDNGVHAVLWQSGHVTDTVLGDDLGNGVNNSFSFATDINDAGEIVGQADFGVAVMWKNGQIQRLSVPPNAVYGIAQSINNRGQIVGAVQLSGGENHAALWDNGVFEDLGTFGSVSANAVGINDLGQVLIYSQDQSANQAQAILWENGQVTNISTGFPGTWTLSSAINNFTQAVGYGAFNSSVQAWLWHDSSTIRLLGLPPVQGTDYTMPGRINDHGLVVGTSQGQPVTWDAPANPPHQISAGGPAVCPYAADTDFTGGKTSVHTVTVDTSAVLDPAPQQVYQSLRFGNFTYTIPGSVAGSSHRVRLHFAETFWTTVGQRLFNVNINGARVLTDYDIVAAAGGARKAVVEEFTVPADSNGQYVISFSTVRDNAAVSGIEIE